MFNRERFLVIHGADPKEWAERHDISPFSGKCSACGAPAETTVPFASGQFRGLMSPPCKCGNQNTPYCVVRDARFGDLFTGGIR